VQCDFNFAGKVVECWDDIKGIEKRKIPESEKGAPWWTPIDVVKLKLKFLDTVAQYIYPKLGQVELKGEGLGSRPIAIQINMGRKNKLSV